MRPEKRKYCVTYRDGSKKEVVGARNLPPKNRVQSIRLIKQKQTVKATEKLAERAYIVKHHDGTEELVTGFFNLPDAASVESIHRAKVEPQTPLNTQSNYMCFADFEYTCGGMAGDTAFDVSYGQEILSVGLAVAERTTGEVVDTFYQTIRPSHNCTLTEFCKSLTGLTQDEIDASENFETVMTNVVAFCRQYDFTQIYVYGTSDRTTLGKDKNRHEKVDGLKAFVSQIYILDHDISDLLFGSSLQLGLEKLKQICYLNEPVSHHALSDAKDLCHVWFHISSGNYDRELARYYQSERLNKAEYYRNRQFLSVRSPGRRSSDDAEENLKETTVNHALQVIDYLKNLNHTQPYVDDIKLTAFCDDLLALLGAPEETFAVQKRRNDR